MGGNLRGYIEEGEKVKKRIVSFLMAGMLFMISPLQGFAQVVTKTASQEDIAEVSSGSMQKADMEEVSSENTQKEESDFVIADGILTEYTGKEAEITIPDGVTSIEENAFKEKKVITKVVFPDSIRTIGYGAFNNCLSLEEINIPPYCQLIGQFAFQSTGIKHIKIPAELGDSIMLDCFMGTLLETIEVEEGNQYYHAENGAFDVFFISKKFNLTPEEQTKLYKSRQPSCERYSYPFSCSLQ